MNARSYNRYPSKEKNKSQNQSTKKGTLHGQKTGDTNLGHSVQRVHVDQPEAQRQTTQGKKLQKEAQGTRILMGSDANGIP